MTNLQSASHKIVSLNPAVFFFYLIHIPELVWKYIHLRFLAFGFGRKFSRKSFLVQNFENNQGYPLPSFSNFHPNLDSSKCSWKWFWWFLPEPWANFQVYLKTFSWLFSEIVFLEYLKKITFLKEKYSFEIPAVVGYKYSSPWLSVRKWFLVQNFEND